MKKAIYKITNNLNGKVYIGQSIDPHKRFRQHINGATRYVSLIHQAIQKYGVENFSFEVLGWFEDYNEKEIWYIKQYNSLIPYGYNIAKGGETPPTGSGENNNFAKITQKTSDRIKQQLMDWNYQLKFIVKDNKVTYNIVQHINDGSSWHDDSLTYPLRPTEKQLDEMRADKVINLLKTTNLSQKEIGQRVGWSRSAVTMINIGKNHHRENEKYPIRT